GRVRGARGGGCRVLEAVARGKAAVAPPAALVGLGAQPGVHLLTATRPAEWTAAIARLLDDPQLRNRLGTAGRRYVEANHRWEDCLKPFASLLGLPSSVQDRECVPLSVSGEVQAVPQVVLGGAG